MSEPARVFLRRWLRRLVKDQVPEMELTANSDLVVLVDGQGFDVDFGEVAELLIRKVTADADPTAEQIEGMITLNGDDSDHLYWVSIDRRRGLIVLRHRLALPK